MAKKKRAARLSIGELRLMGLLWERGPLTLSQAFEAQPGQLGYTTVQTQLNRLVEKGMVSRTKSRPMSYRAMVNPQAAGAGLLQLLIDSIGGGSILPVVRQLISRVTLTIDDVRELKQMVNDASPKSLKKSSKSGAKPKAKTKVKK